MGGVGGGGVGCCDGGSCCEKSGGSISCCGGGVGAGIPPVRADMSWDMVSFPGGCCHLHSLFMKEMRFWAIA